MKITDGEKLILLMLCELYENLGVDGEIDPKFIQKAIFSESTWAIPFKYHGISFEDDDTPEVVHEVLNILGMWRSIEDSFGDLSKKDRIAVAREAEPFGKNPKFPGFDGNNESAHLGAAGFLINQLERYEEFKGRDLNSHAPLLEAYRRMYDVFDPISRNLMGNLLGTKQLVEVLRERAHPENR